MNSMTGFGRASVSRGGVMVALQVSSVNRKNLEIVVSLPKEFQGLDRKLQEIVRSRVSRGRFQFSLDIRPEDQSSSNLPSERAMDEAIAYFKRYAESRRIAFDVDGANLVEIAKAIDSDTVDIEEKEVESPLFEALDEAMNELLAMRGQEGIALKQDLSSRRGALLGLVDEIRQLAPGMVEKHRENLHARLKQIGLDLDLDDERVLKEIALFSDRCDVSEELTRLDSHLQQFEQLIDQDGPIGRSLEFLIQEIAREINTTGSKASSIEVSKKTLDMKNELERIREQVANVE